MSRISLSCFFGAIFWVGLLSGCSELSALLDILSPAATELEVLPPCVQDECNCGDFRNQALAQRVLDGFVGDPYKLDQDGNGQACESLPALSSEMDATGSASRSLHMVLGNPSSANTANLNNYLIERSQYALSYNRDRGMANWASWQLSANWLGGIDRQNDFRQDGSLPAGVYQVTPNDYRGSGFDRGHLVPSGDRTATRTDNSATFFMTNIVPQAPDNNRGPWRELEAYSRDVVYQQDKVLFVIAGAYGQGKTLARGRVVIPTRLWKVIVVLDPFEVDPLTVDADTPVVAVDLPNRNNLSADWRSYQTSVDSIEAATGYDLLANLPDEVEALLEAKE
ncbi:MAG: DNA/RNA non-specific endonuclease [Leptolyngbyaceae cyanobacterium SM1_1_3]|nr:DNA/RNA non-specific endonuclease [Leptolyngbyaceae cyanobacterium SM1_1_3]NJN04502.1 DNA/RNA non-specific endonuclease [Leptolyngbyaceae cyanobacterium RM1_1_2]NJO11232.1 DNA/RNA non-specific endonuclease [Leptolyngbyaceae cyanobacterium SL_1_1]